MKRRRVGFGEPFSKLSCRVGPGSEGEPGNDEMRNG